MAASDERKTRSKTGSATPRVFPKIEEVTVSRKPAAKRKTPAATKKASSGSGAAAKTKANTSKPRTTTGAGVKKNAAAPKKKTVTASSKTTKAKATVAKPKKEPIKVGAPSKKVTKAAPASSASSKPKPQPKAAAASKAKKAEEEGEEEGPASVLATAASGLTNMVQGALLKVEGAVTGKSGKKVRAIHFCDGLQKC